MTEYIVCHIENHRHYVLDTWPTPAAAREHLATVVDVAWGEGAIVTLPTVGGEVSTDRAVIEVIDPAAMGRYEVKIIPVVIL